MPILPMILVNGASGIGTGWATNIPNFNPRLVSQIFTNIRSSLISTFREIVANLKRMIAGEPLKDMYPWYKNYKGSIEPLDHQRYVVNGEISTLSDSKVSLNALK